jgi:mannitol-1-phosphate 5-dehydrogenase
MNFKMRTAVQIGAGNIGRGFIAQIFRDSDYQVVFIDINRVVVDAINRQRYYQIEMVDNQGTTVKTIDRIKAVYGEDVAATADVIAGADLMAVSVGVAALAKVASMIAAGLRQRWREGRSDPLNILVCENLINAPGVLRRELYQYLATTEQEKLEQTIGLVETSIGRMVPGQNYQAGGDPLTCRVEPYCKLPADRDGFVGEIPALSYLEPFTPFAFMIRRKLYIHNFGHAILAYLGYVTGKQFIWEAAEDAAITAIAVHALHQVAGALAAEYKVSPVEIRTHINQLLQRFANRALGDTVARVGHDPWRKLGPEDRIIGAYRLLEKYQSDTSVFPLLIAAGLRFAPTGDETAVRIRKTIADVGLASAVQQICGLQPEETALLLPDIRKYYRFLPVEADTVIRKAAAAQACALELKKGGSGQCQ